MQMTYHTDIIVVGKLKLEKKCECDERGWKHVVWKKIRLMVDDGWKRNGLVSGGLNYIDKYESYRDVYENRIDVDVSSRYFDVRDSDESVIVEKEAIELECEVDIKDERYVWKEIQRKI